MNFKHTISTRASIQKKKVKYEFDITNEQEEQGRKSTQINPFIFRSEKECCLIALYTYNGILRLNLLHSYDGFDELIEVR